jgi:hypothetical protein
MVSRETDNSPISEAPSYFFVAVSTKENLDLCREYGLAGFPGSQNGAWTFADIEVGDYVSFVYGANAYDLYEVGGKRAVLNAADLPPWPALELNRGGTYHFPFRLGLEPKRELEENLVRSEFRYIAETRRPYSRFLRWARWIRQSSQLLSGPWRLERPHGCDGVEASNPQKSTSSSKRYCTSYFDAGCRLSTD